MTTSEVSLEQTFSLTDGKSRFELNLLRWDEDALVAVRIDSHGFSGHNDLFIIGPAFVDFCRDVITAQQTLKSEAVLAAVPHDDELKVIIRPLGSLGRYEVVGNTGYHVPDENGASSYWHNVQFGFEIEPGQLDIAARIPWVQACAAKPIRNER